MTTMAEEKEAAERRRRRSMLCRMAGNIAGGLATNGITFGTDNIAELAVGIALAIEDRINKEIP